MSKEPLLFHIGEPHGNSTGDSYITDGYRAVLWGAAASVAFKDKKTLLEISAGHVIQYHPVEKTEIITPEKNTNDSIIGLLGFLQVFSNKNGLLFTKVRVKDAQKLVAHLILVF